MLKQDHPYQFEWKIATLGLLIVLSMVTAFRTIDAEDGNSTPYIIKAQKDGDSVKVQVEGGKTFFSVHSPFGISQTVIERTEEKWPGVVLLRLHLKGLENFRASNGTLTLHAAVSRVDEKENVRVWKDGRENAPLDSSSMFWMAIRYVRIDDHAAAKPPLHSGYFEIQLPEAFLAGNPKAITLSWIDFYRN